MNLRSRAGRTAIVDGKDRESSLGQNFMEESGGTGPVLDPAVSDQLPGRASVDIYDQRVSCLACFLSGSRSSP